MCLWVAKELIIYMKLNMKKLLAIILIIGSLIYGLSTNAQMDLWKYVSGLLQPVVSTWSVYAPSNLRFDGEIQPDGATCAANQILKRTGVNDWDCATDAGEFSTTTNDYWGSQRAGTAIDWSSGFNLDATGAWTGTFDGYQGADLLTRADFYSTTTSEIAEGSNLYYTEARVKGVINATTTLTIDINGNASTATNLAANPTDCASSETAAYQIDASGNLTCSSFYNSLSDISLTEGYIIVGNNAGVASATSTMTINADTGAVIIGGTLNVTGQITGNVTGALTGNAATATALASNPTDCAANQFANTIAASGNLTCAAIADADVPDTITASSYLLLAGGTLTGILNGTNIALTYGLSAATSTITTLTGSLVGNASTATALAANGANCAAGQYPLGVNASGAVEDCTAAGAGGGGSNWSFSSPNAISPTTTVGIIVNASSTFTGNLTAGANNGLVVGSSYVTIGGGTTNLAAVLRVRALSGIDHTVAFITNDFVAGTTGSQFALLFGAATGNTYSELRALDVGGSTWNNLVMQSGGGNVGIGTTGPSSKLTLFGGNMAVSTDGSATTTISSAGSTFAGGITGTLTGSASLNLLRTDWFTTTTQETITSLPSQFLYPAFTYSTTTWSGTTTIALGAAYTAETWSGVKCFSNVGTLVLAFGDGTNKMNSVAVSTTVGEVSLTTNNAFTADEKRYAEIGSPATAPTVISCTIKKVLK